MGFFPGHCAVHCRAGFGDAGESFFFENEPLKKGTGEVEGGWWYYRSVEAQSAKRAPLGLEINLCISTQPTLLIP